MFPEMDQECNCNKCNEERYFPNHKIRQQIKKRISKTRRWGKKTI